MASPTTPIPIPMDGHPSPFMLPETHSFGSSGSSNGQVIVLSKLPERPSVLTNKLSPNNAIPIDPNQPEPPLILSNTLPSVRHPSISRSRSVSSRNLSDHSELSTPALSNCSSKTASRNITPISSPSNLGKAIGGCGTRSGVLSPKELVSATEMLAESKRLYDLLSEEERYLIFLREEVGMTVWAQIADTMTRKGYPCKEQGLRLRYCILKRDLDVRLKAAIENVHVTQVEVDKVLGIGAARTRRLASFSNRKVYGLRVFEEEEEAALKSLAASLRASGIK